MEEKREPLSQMAIERKIQLLRSKNVDNEIIALVKSDYEDGLTEDEVELYLNKSYDVNQMKVLSTCLHKGVSEEMVTLLRESKMSGGQMQTALNYYEKGVPVAAIKEVVEKDDTAINMRRMLDVVLENLSKAKEQKPEDSEYVKALVAQMEEVVEKINHQNERYDALNKKLSEIETSKDDEEVRERLVKENQDKDEMINSQQNELNRANGTIARLRDDIEKKDKEMKRMSERIESLEDKIMGIAINNQNPKDVLEGGNKENVEKAMKPEPVADTKETVTDKRKADTVVSDTIAISPAAPMMPNGIPVYYQVSVVDAAGNVVQRVPIERSTRKSSNTGMAGLLARLCFKKKSRADIVKLVASGDLVPAQLVQIKSAIEKGLTENQLVELINNNISAEKMKEIIEIAVLENSMAD